MFKIITLFLLTSFSNKIIAQINIAGKFENGDFECVGNNDKPINWFLTPTKYYLFSPDSVNPYSGIFSGRISPTNICSKKSSGSCYKRVIISNIENNIKVNFHLKVNSGHYLSITHFVYPMSKNYDFDFGKFIDTTIIKITGDTSNNNWFTYSVELQFDKKVNSNDFFHIGVLMQDSTDFNIDNVEILKDGKKINEYPCTFEKRILPNEDDITWLEKNKIPILNTNDNVDLKDISKLRNVFGNSSIIALGESTHGTKEFYTLRTRIIKYLVDSLNFQIIAFESGFENYNLANQLLEKTNLTSHKIVDSLFATNIYKTDEVVNLVDLLRKRNINNPNKKTIITGFDSQEYYYPGLQLEETFRNLDTNLYKLTHEINLRIKNAKVKQIDSIYKLALNLNNCFKKNENGLIKSNKALDFILLKKRLNSLSNGLYLKYLYEKVKYQDDNNDFGFASSFRDSVMAENVIWLRKYYSGKKIIILCHNQHVQKNKLSLEPFIQKNQGYFLQKILPKGAYKSFAFLTAEGQLTGYKKYTPEVVQVIKPYKSCYEYYFAKMKDSIFFLALPKNKESLKHNNILSGLKMRQAGYGISDGYDPFKEVDLLNGFDGLFFIKSTSQTSSFLY